MQLECGQRQTAHYFRMMQHIRSALPRQAQDQMGTGVDIAGGGTMDRLFRFSGGVPSVDPFERTIQCAFHAILDQDKALAAQSLKIG